jgi:hypothetical protein
MFLSQAYKAKTARKMAAPIPPKVMVLRTPEELVSCEGVAVALIVPFAVAETAKVVEAGTSHKLTSSRRACNSREDNLRDGDGSGDNSGG